MVERNVVIKITSIIDEYKFLMIYKMKTIFFNGIVLVVILFSCISCDAPYFLFVENKSNKDVEVFVKSKVKINFDSLRYSENKISKKELRLFNLRKTESENFTKRSKITKTDSLSYSIIIKPGATSFIGPHPIFSPFKSISYLKENQKIYFSKNKNDSADVGLYPTKTILEIK